MLPEEAQRRSRAACFVNPLSMPIIENCMTLKVVFCHLTDRANCDILSSEIYSHRVKIDDTREDAT